MPADETSAATGPSRIRRSRGKGARLPAGAIYIGRPSVWGNPFTVIRGAGRPATWHASGLDVHGPARASSELARADAVELFALHTRVLGLAEYDEETLTQLRQQLRGHDLACWCPLTGSDGTAGPCHGDILLELANS